MNYFLLEQYLLSQGKTPKTVDGYLFSIRKFIDLHPNFATYEYTHITAYFASLNEVYRREDGRVTATVNGIFYAVKALYLYLVKIGVRDDLPFPPSFSIKGTRARGLNTKKLLTPTELDQLMHHVRSEALRFPKLALRNQVVVSLLVYQALLSEEILKLCVTDVDVDAGVLHIAPSVNANGRRLSLHPSQYIPFYAYLMEGRKQLLKGYADTGQFIIGARPMTEQVGGIGSLLRKYQMLFPEREMTATAIRQSVIYKWLNVDTQPLEVVQTWAGHKWPSTTERYINKIDLDDPNAINGFHPMELI